MCYRNSRRILAIEQTHALDVQLLVCGNVPNTGLQNRFT